MIRVFRNVRSFGDKVTLLATLVSGFAVSAVCGLLALADYVDLRQETYETVQSHANMVAINSGAPLVFGDREHGAEALAVLRAVPHVAGATLFDRAGDTFASYQREKDASPRFALALPGQARHDRWLVLDAPIVDQGERRGSLQIVYDLEHVDRRLWSSVLITVAVAFAAMLLAYLFAFRIRRGLLLPIDELVRTARSVSESKDYALRAAKLSDDELGELTDAFNEMLSQIRKQEMELHAAHAERESLLESERAARAESDRASRMKDDFVATLSHELRTPLTPILGWAQILRRTGPRDEQLLSGLEIIERNARIQIQMIEDLLDMSRIISGKVRLDVQKVDLADVIEAAVATVRPAADAREIRMQAVIDPNVGPVRGDPNRLQQIAWNLLSNAIKFTGKGGRVQVALQRVNSHIEIIVSDSGQGISTDFLPHVFQRFRQADSSITRRHGGLGLGLAIVKQLVELHGGTVRASSPGENLGATFTVCLPLMALAAEEMGATREHPRASRGAPVDTDQLSFPTLEVLVVDDDADARDLLARFMQQCDARVTLASSAAEALQILQTAHVDLLISDIGMPDADGYELIRRVRELPSDAGGTIPAIALTAFARSEDRARALLSGYQLHISKPVDPSELIAAVASLARAPQRAT